MRFVFSVEITRFGHPLSEHEEMINHPGRWPEWPVLSLKRRRGLFLSEQGFIVDLEWVGYGVSQKLPGPIRVHHGTITCNDGTYEEFTSTAALLLAGWGVE